MPIETPWRETLASSARVTNGVVIPRVVDIDLFHRREIRHRAGAVRAVVRVPQADRDAPVTNFSRPSVRLGTRPAALHRLPDTKVSRCAARLTGRAPRRMKQVNISDPWYKGDALCRGFT